MTKNRHTRIYIEGGGIKKTKTKKVKAANNIKLINEEHYYYCCCTIGHNKIYARKKSSAAV